MTVTVTPNPAKPGDTLSIDVTGLPPRQWLGYLVNGQGAGSRFQVDSTGTITLGWPLNAAQAEGALAISVTRGTATLQTGSVTVKKPVPVPPPTPAPGIALTAGPTTTVNADGTVTVRWSLSAVGTGWCDFGPTTSLGTTGPKETSFDYASHVQSPAGLTAGMFVRVSGAGKDGSTYVSPVVAVPGAVVPTPPQTPVPPPVTGRPSWPAPVTTRSIDVPAQVADLGAWIRAQPDGSVLRFPAGATYTIASGIVLDGRRDLVLTGAATIRSTTDGKNIIASTFVLGNGAAGSGPQRITLDGLTLVGSRPPSSTVFTSGTEAGCGVWMGRGSSCIELSNLTITDHWGHAAYIAAGNPNPGPSSHVWLHGLSIARMGTMGIVPVAVTDLLAEDCYLRDIALYPVDFEDGQAGQPLRDITFRRTTLDGWGLDNRVYTTYGIAAKWDGSPVQDWANVTIDATVFRTGPTIRNGSHGRGAWIAIATDTYDKPGVVVTNTVDQSGYVGSDRQIWLSRCPGAIVRGNALPVSIDSSPGATVGPNP